MSINPLAPTPETKPYAASLKVDYPTEPLNRLTSFFRIFTIIPIAIILSLIVGSFSGWSSDSSWKTMGSSGAILFLPLVLMILFRKKYPKWWFDWHLSLVRFCYRVSTYFALLTDKYPSTDEEQAAHVELVYPDAQTQLARGMPLVKWFLAIPHYFVLIFLGIAAFVCIIFAWFAILFTGRYPQGLFDFVVGVMRWSLRVEAYAFMLLTDKYPPFSLEA